MTAPVVVVMPGASLMDIHLVDGGLEVRCPGCDAARVYPVGTTGHVTFEHEDNCPVHARIKAVVDAYERSTLKG